MLEVEKHFLWRDYSIFPKYVGCENYFLFLLEASLLISLYKIIFCHIWSKNKMPIQFNKYLLNTYLVPIPY